MDHEQAVSLIARTRLFAGLDPTALAVIAAEGHERTYKRHAPIFLRGSGRLRLLELNSHGYVG